MIILGVWAGLYFHLDLERKWIYEDVTTLENQVKNLEQENTRVKDNYNTLTENYKTLEKDIEEEKQKEKENNEQSSNIEKQETENKHFDFDVTIFLVGKIWYDMSWDISRYLVPITEKVSAKNMSSKNKIYHALKKLFAIKELKYGSDGLQNMLVYSNLDIDTIEVKNGETIVKIKGDLIGIGWLWDPFLKLQITETIAQYSNNYKIMLNGSEKEWECALNNKDNCWKTTSTKNDRYRKIYSTKYSLYTKPNGVYKICLAENNDVCINLIQYNGTFDSYYLNEFFISLDSNIPPHEVVDGKLHRTCTMWVAESLFCYVESKKWTLIMDITDVKWEWFHGGEHDPRELLKVIGF